MAYLALGAWALTCLAGGAALMASHLVSLPDPPSVFGPGELAVRLAPLRPAGPPRWLAVHELLEGCGCSRRVMSHLAERGPRRDVAEVVLIGVGAHRGAEGLREARERAAPLSARGFRVEVMVADQLADRWGLVSAPALVVLAPSGGMAWAGGYTSSRNGPELLDDEVLGALVAGRAPPAVPVLGCAVSASLKQALDPFGLKEIAQ